MRSPSEQRAYIAGMRAGALRMKVVTESRGVDAAYRQVTGTCDMLERTVDSEDEERFGRLRAVQS